MKIPENVAVKEFKASYCWIDKDGIVYSVPKLDAPELSREETDEEVKAFKNYIGNKKVCLLIESNPKAKPPSKEDRDHISKIFDSICKAMAIITTSPVSKMIANLFFGLKPPAYPAKMFTSEIEAKEWLKQYLKD